jgi:transcriptional regulator with XRE-family HTH domain
MKLLLEEALRSFNERHPDRPLTQRALADALGTKEQRISEYKAGRRMPGGPTLIKLAAALDCRAEDLLGS